MVVTMFMGSAYEPAFALYVFSVCRGLIILAMGSFCLTAR
jgi:hypothetical protein